MNHGPLKYVTSVTARVSVLSPILFKLLQLKYINMYHPKIYLKPQNTEVKLVYESLWDY
jgi:hypothetical protein